MNNIFDKVKQLFGVNQQAPNQADAYQPKSVGEAGLSQGYNFLNTVIQQLAKTQSLPMQSEYTLGKALVADPLYDAAKVYGGIGYEGARKISSAMGDKNAYYDQKTGKIHENPFLDTKTVESWNPKQDTFGPIKTGIRGASDLSPLLTAMGALAGGGAQNPVGQTDELTQEQIIEKAGGWKIPGLRAKFDTAMLHEDWLKMKSLLPSVPPDYQQRFVQEIAGIASKAGAVWLPPPPIAQAVGNVATAAAPSVGAQYMPKVIATAIGGPTGVKLAHNFVNDLTAHKGNLVDLLSSYLNSEHMSDYQKEEIKRALKQGGYPAHKEGFNDY